MAAVLTAPIASSTPWSESASQIEMLPVGKPYCWAVRLAREFGTMMADVQWSGRVFILSAIRLRHSSSTARPSGMRSCREPVVSAPEAFSSPSVTTTWRKLCSPYSSQM